MTIRSPSVTGTPRLSARSFDVIIVGGGPAGLSAALVLGRARRRVIVVDDGRPRNAPSRALHGLLSRDGIAPLELLRVGREEMQRYETVELLDDRVERARRQSDRFHLESRGGIHLAGRKLLLATGVIDDLPDVPGLRELYGRSAFHCPYCDGWEVRDQPLAAYGHDERAGALALELLSWSKDVVLCLDGRSGLSRSCRDRLSRNGVQLREEPIARLEGRDGVLDRILFQVGPPLVRRALFFYSRRKQASDLAAQLGCEMDEDTGCKVERPGRTTVPGLYVIGDASRDVLQVAVAIGEGSEAAIAVNTELMNEDLA